jgi:hypothetical protein
MKHFNIDKLQLVESTLGTDQVCFVYTDADLLLPDFYYYTARNAVLDLLHKDNLGRFKRAVFLQTFLSLAKEKHIYCSYTNYNPNQFKDHGNITIVANHFMSFTLNLSTVKNAIIYKTTRFAHDEISAMKSVIEHAEGQLNVIKDMQELLDEVNEVLLINGPKIDNLFK